MAACAGTFCVMPSWGRPSCPTPAPPRGSAGPLRTETPGPGDSENRQGKDTSRSVSPGHPHPTLTLIMPACCPQGMGGARRYSIVEVSGHGPGPWGLGPVPLMAGYSLNRWWPVKAVPLHTGARKRWGGGKKEITHLRVNNGDKKKDPCFTWCLGEIIFYILGFFCRLKRDKTRTRFLKSSKRCG